MLKTLCLLEKYDGGICAIEASTIKTGGGSRYTGENMVEGVDEVIRAFCHESPFPSQTFDLGPLHYRTTDLSYSAR